MGKPIFAVIDCNNFFVSCEKVFRPDLEGRPVVVLSNNDGCAVSRSNEAKQLGIPMASPHFEYKHLYDQHNVVQFSANFSLYGDFSARVVKLTERYVPADKIEVYSIDESFLRLDGIATANITDYMRKLRQDILKWTGIPVSIGIASSKTLAKAAVEYAKKNPETNYVYRLKTHNQIEHVLGWLPIGDVWGIGRRLAPKLESYGVKTALDYTHLRLGWVRENFKSNGVRLQQELLGNPMYWLEIDNLTWRKNIAATRSFGRPVTKQHELEESVASFIARAARKLRRQGGVAQNISIYARTSKGSFRRGSGWRSSAEMKLPVATNDSRVLTKAAVDLVPQVYKTGIAYAKSGILLSDITHEPQLSMLEEYDSVSYSKQQKLMLSLDSINKKWGDSTIRLGREGIAQTWRGKRAKTSPQYTQNWNQLPKVRS